MIYGASRKDLLEAEGGASQGRTQQDFWSVLMNVRASTEHMA